MPQIEVRAADRRKPSSLRISRQAQNVTSFDGEDGVIAAIFDTVAPVYRLCVEFGAHDGVTGSNVWSLIHRQGWNGVLIEGDETRHAQLAANYAGRDVKAFNRYVGLKAPERIDDILAEAGTPTPDLMVIDVDGMDWHIWNGMAVRPRVVAVEFNHSVPNEVVFVQDPDPALNQGASLRAFVELGKRKGYELVATTITNAFFVEAGLFPNFGIADNSIDAMYFNERWWSWIFQGYDGSLFLAGNKNLIWKNLLPLEHEDIQPLPRSLRRMG